jgi:chromate transporter
MSLMVVVTYQLGRAVIIDFTTIALAIISGAILFRFRLNSAWLVLGGAIAGWLLFGRVNI